MIAEPTALPISGLSESEVAARQAKGEGNTALPYTTRTYTQIIRENVFTFINDALFILGIALVLVGRPLDALVSVGVIMINIVVSIVQETRAKRMLDHIALLTRPKAIAVRDGVEREVSLEQLVVGDLLTIGAGDQVVLDGMVMSGKAQLDESQLTGESDLIPKQVGDAVYSGSFCINGSLYYRADKVGSASLANQITSGARGFRRALTPLQSQINVVVRVILLIVIYLQLLLTLNALVKEVRFSDAVGNATVLAGLVPNGLFLSIAVAYALGALRIVRFGALVQQSNAIESLSNVDVLCLDKTGTLTANKLSLQEVYPLTGDKDKLTAILGSMVASATSGNKTSAAIMAAFPAKPQPITSDVPFSSARKWSAVAFAPPGEQQASDDLQGVYALGAPEFVHPYLAEDTDWQAIMAQIRPLTDQGLRVLLVAHQSNVTTIKDEGDDSVLPAGMQPLGCISLSDELRPEARETLSQFAALGVKLKIISGDNPETVAALARQAGLGPDITLISGPQLEQMSEADFADAAKNTTIFGRITPQQKERLVDSLRAQGHYVAMIGDGVNDVLSLKKSNLGVAMESGSQATRSVADIVLTNDSFAALLPALREGQRILNGMQDIIKLFLCRISTVALLIISSLVIGYFPISLRNGSIITLITVGIPTILLAIWARPGKLEGTLGRRLLHFVLPAALLSSVIGLLVFYIALDFRSREVVRLFTTPGTTASPDQIDLILRQHAALLLPVPQTALATFLVFVGLFLVIFVAPPTAWWGGGDLPISDKKPTILAVALMAAFVIISFTPPLQRLFLLEPLQWQYVAIVVVAVPIWLLLIRFFWRHKLLDRFLGVGNEKPASPLSEVPQC
jgi:cation-transporting P-type ATPase E